MSATAVLPDGYYLANLRRLIDTVIDQYPDLVSAQDRAFATVFHQLDDQSARLLARLISRKGPLFRTDRLSYPDIADLLGAVKDLVSTGLVECDSPDVDLAPILRRSELAIAVRSIGQPVGRHRRHELIQLLRDAGVSLRAAIPDGVDVLRLRYRQSIETFFLLFFGNPRQDLSEFVRSDLGVVRYESVPLSGAPPFPDRAAVERAITLFDWMGEVHRAVEGSSTVDLTAVRERLPCADPVPWIERHRQQACIRLARSFERNGEPEHALALYEKCDGPPGRERRARLLAAAGRLPEAYAVCEQVAMSPRTEQERVFSKSFGHRLAKRLGKRVPRRARFYPPMIPVVLSACPQGAVEDVVLQWYRDRNYSGIRSENVLWSAIFGLLFWDVVFSPVSGAFLHPFQRGPRDLNDFWIARRAMIEARLGDIGEGEAPLRAREVCFEKLGIVNPFVQWTQVSLDDIEMALERIPPACLGYILERIAVDPVENRSGLPDLLVFPPNSGYLLVEVKSPGDRLQENQTRWFRWFVRHQIHCRVVRLTWPGRP